MLDRSIRPLSHANRLVLAIAMSIGLAACSGAGQAPTSQQPMKSPAPTATTEVVEPATPRATPDGGPVDYAAWVEVQGFGGSSGLRQVLRGAEWIRDNPTIGNAFDIEMDMRVATNLAAWLDAHPATACWAEYHTTVRASLDRIHDAFAEARDARAAGAVVPQDVADRVVSEAQAAADLAEPAGC
jgi:hypothetical protein